MKMLKQKTEDLLLKLELIIYGLCWYCEYDNHIRIHDYFSIMIGNFPIIVIRKLDNPHSESDDADRIIIIGILGFTKVIKKPNSI
jgi:uncharacterized membrane protein